MKIFYVISSALPSKYAHSIHFVKQCEGFANSGNDVELICSKNPYPGDISNIFDYYGLKPNFNVKQLANYGRQGRLFYFAKIILYLFTQKGIVYTRDKKFAFFAIFFGLPTIYELHTPLIIAENKNIWNWMYKWMLRRENLLKIVVITQPLKELLLPYTSKNNIIVAPDGATPPLNSKRIAYPAFQHSSNFHVGYTGGLFPGKGMEIIVKLAELLPNTYFHIIGGFDNDIKTWEQISNDRKLKNILFYGHKPYNEISAFINGFDCCVLPNQRNVILSQSAKNVDIGSYTSPLKMFDYMAHGKAIIASDLPVLREVLNDDNSILCNPDNIQEWVDAINFLSESPQMREKLGKAAFNDFNNNYTWKKRAEKILEGIKTS